MCPPNCWYQYPGLLGRACKRPYTAAGGGQQICCQRRAHRRGCLFVCGRPPSGARLRFLSSVYMVGRPARSRTWACGALSLQFMPRMRRRLRRWKLFSFRSQGLWMNSSTLITVMAIGPGSVSRNFPHKVRVNSQHLVSFENAS